MSDTGTNINRHGPKETFFLSTYHSPLGTYTLASSRKGVICLATELEAHRRLRCWESEGILLRQSSAYNATLARELDDYFSGRLRQFTVPLDLRGTPFQRQVWQELGRIPYGETRTYGQIARALGRPNAARAVGQANRYNPVAIMVPCHRVVGTNGKLTGYAGGLDRKKALLHLEAAALLQGAS